MSRRRATIREAARAGLALGLLFGGGAFLVLLTFMGLDYRSTRDVPTEQARIVSVEPSGTRVSCGRTSARGVRTTFRSETAPDGLPAEFSVVECPGAVESVGDRVPVRRTGTTEDDITLDPIESRSDWLVMAVTGGVVCAFIAATVGVVRELWSAWRSRRRRARRHAKLEQAD